MQSQRMGSLMTPARSPCPRCLYCGIHLHLIHLDPAPGLSSCQGGGRSEHLDRLLRQVTPISSEPKISSTWFLQYVAIFRNAADKEALEGKISYYPPSRAIPFGYFPYLVDMILEALTQSFSFSIRARGTKNTRTLDTTRHWLQSRWNQRLILWSVVQFTIYNLLMFIFYSFLVLFEWHKSRLIPIRWGS